jgi:hypothetical protein
MRRTRRLMVVLGTAVTLLLVAAYGASASQHWAGCPHGSASQDNNGSP